jgi:SAM-dependent methyltransferase
MSDSIYKSEPIARISDKIPVFSPLDPYIENYEKISTDHVNALKETGQNPFMDEKLWKECEDATAEIVKRYLKPEHRILDVGVGTGRLLDMLQCANKYGIDISTEYLKITAQKDIEVCYGLIEDMPYKDGVFDVIVCTDVLEHVLDLKLASEKILACLKPGGHLIVRVPYRENLEHYLDAPYEFVHLRNFDEYSLFMHFNKIMKCEVLHHSTVGSSPHPDRLKTVYRFPKGYNFYRQIGWIIKRIRPGFWKKINEAIHYHTEINMVVRKPAQSNN